MATLTLGLMSRVSSSGAAAEQTKHDNPAGQHGGRSLLLSHVTTGSLLHRPCLSSLSLTLSLPLSLYSDIATLSWAPRLRLTLFSPPIYSWSLHPSLSVPPPSFSLCFYPSLSFELKSDSWICNHFVSSAAEQCHSPRLSLFPPSVCQLLWTDFIQMSRLRLLLLVPS